ncbi:DUF3137 domain-containing protein [Pelagibius litoralis]|uniref:DUF3137 domain-containing protein n=1 Tax=Pelagibius litoralis TaxID=374515 RepID=A0A967F143_9PROT|nr:DUF3137 domain-containing protein [Pelagibius litoralis]NIA71139.1 DUF3137 domain-containing protein [Pelagibius litoralis]
MAETTKPAEGNRSFEDFFAAEVAPGLAPLEVARKERLRAAYTRAAGTAFVTAAATGIALAWSAEPIVPVLTAAAGLIGGFFWTTLPGRRHRAALRKLVVEPLRRFLGGLEYHRKPGGRFDLEVFRRSGVTAGFNRAKLEDLLIGRYRDTDYSLVEARLKQSRRSGTKREERGTFTGLLCQVSVPVTFTCTVLLIGDKGKLGNWVVDLVRSSLTNLSAVTMNHKAFEARYQVYSDQPEEARALLQTALLDSLLAISEAVGRKSVNCAFIDGRFLIAIPHGDNLFEIGRLHRSLEHAEEDVRRLAVEFTIPHRLIDTLHGDRPQTII